MWERFKRMVRVGIVITCVAFAWMVWIVTCKSLGTWKEKKHPSLK